VNVEGTKNIAEACKISGTKFMFISSDYVYDGTKATPYSEKDKAHPINYYGKTKLIAEKVIEAIDLDFVIARTAVLFGASKNYEKAPFPIWLIQQLKEGKEVKVVIDQYNNPTLADSLAEFLFSLYEKDRSGVFNISGKDNLSRYEFAKLIAGKFGMNENQIKPITTAELNQPAKRPQKVSLNVSKAEKAAKLSAMDIDEALDEFAKQYKKVRI
jgi:dTDP-4-dehydrorhamnose reductase